jgi:hypothetical protein
MATQTQVKITRANNEGYGFALPSQFGMHGKAIFIAYGKSINGICPQYECQDDNELHGASAYCKNCQKRVDSHEIVGYRVR